MSQHWKRKEFDLQLDWVLDWVIDWLLDWVEEWVLDWELDWVSDWLSDWLNGWFSAWLDGCVSVHVTVSVSSISTNASHHECECERERARERERERERETQRATIGLVWGVKQGIQLFIQTKAVINFGEFNTCFTLYKTRRFPLWILCKQLNWENVEIKTDEFICNGAHFLNVVCFACASLDTQWRFVQSNGSEKEPKHCFRLPTRFAKS